MNGTGITRNNGMLRVVSNVEFAQRQAQAEQERQAREAANQPVMTSLAAHLRRQWDVAKNGKSHLEERMRKALRQRTGQYEADKLAEIRKTGGSEIYMMLTPMKCRAAASWIRDALLGQGAEKPWTLASTPVPDLPGREEEDLMKSIGVEVGQMVAAGMPPPMEVVEERIETARKSLLAKLREKARQKAQETEQKLEDALLEGGFLTALDEAIDDLVTFPYCVVKGPVPMTTATLEWVEGPTGWESQVTNQIVKTYKRIDPFKFYWMPWATNVHEGDCFELHELTPSALYDLIGSPGYNEAAIREVLELCRNGTVYTDWATGLHEGAPKKLNELYANDRPIQALEFWGAVSGDLLIQWGMDATQVPDPQRQYNVNAWLIGPNVIKAVINIDPLGSKPYEVTSYETIPGQMVGNGVPDLIRDVQDMCNAAARNLVNNMAMASGPMVWVNSERMPPGEKVTTIHPWKLFQGTTDPMGSTAPPIEFFQPQPMVGELIKVFEFFSALADEYSGIPRYMMGDARVGGAGRTSSGLSMLMGNATKLMKQVLGNLDRVVEGIVGRTHTFMMRFEPSAELQGDVKVIARGVNSVTARETMQLRRNEFLAMTANPFDMQVLGPRGRAYLLRENAKALGMNTDEIVPDPLNMPTQMPMMPGQPGQPGMGQVPGQEGMGGPADMSMRPEGAFMDRMAT